MEQLTKLQFKRLAGVDTFHCISIYIPTHLAGMEVANRKDAILLGSQLKEVRQKLEAQGIQENEIGQLLKPAESLIDEKKFWQHQSKGLAIFISENTFETYRLPLHFNPVNIVSKGFYLKPLLPLFSKSGEFFILALGLKNTKMYKASRYHMDLYDPINKLPKRMEESVGFDYQQKSLQFKTQKSGEASFHGHGEGKEDRKDEILRYLRDINERISRDLQNENIPLVLACLDYLFPIYKDANTYQQLKEDFVQGNPSDLGEEELHKQAWDIVRPEFEQEFNEKKARFNQLHGTGKTSANIREVVPAAAGGRVDTLFVPVQAELWGSYNQEKKSVNLTGEDDSSGISLLNLAALEVFDQGGSVYLLDEGDMPDPNSKVNALFRY